MYDPEGEKQTQARTIRVPVGGCIVITCWLRHFIPYGHRVLQPSTLLLSHITSKEPSHTMDDSPFGGFGRAYCAHGRLLDAKVNARGRQHGPIGLAAVRVLVQISRAPD